MSPQARIALQVQAARKANHLAIRFALRGDFINGQQAKILALRAMQQARELKTKE